MNRATFDELVALTVQETAQLLIAKGAEYSSQEDRLSNFKWGAQHISVTPLQVALIYSSKHFDALSTYIRNDARGMEQILSEPIEGRIHDMINYLLLIKALIVEAKGEQQ